MFFWSKPTVPQLEAFLARQVERPFSYAKVGATATSPPPGFVVDHTRVQLGNGEPVFLAAKRAIERWQQLELGWLTAWPNSAPPRTGGEVMTVVRTMGLWWANACRVVQVIEELGPVQKYGFAYGTLAGHVECGEERFLVEWNRAEGTVWYDILAFSRPARVLARLGYPLVRRLQKQFARESAAKMQRMFLGAHRV